MRASDLIGRLGGEEFAAMLTDTTREKAMAVAERIRRGFAEMAQDVDGRPVCATVSIGLVHSVAATLDLPELLAQADHALYSAKERGRNRAEIAPLGMVIERAGSTGTAPVVGSKSAA